MTPLPNHYPATPRNEERQMRRRRLRPGRTPAIMALLLSAALTLAAAPPSAQAAAVPTAIQDTCTIPDVIGFTGDDAAYYLAVAGFQNVTRVGGDFHPDYPVVRQEPAIGNRYPCDIAVGLLVTIYIEVICRVAVPYVEGLKLKPAMDRIAANHLVPKLNSSGANWVMRQNPPGGAIARCRTKVYLTPGPPGTDPP